MAKLKSKMRLHQIMDLRNILNEAEAKALGFAYSCVGK